MGVGHEETVAAVHSYLGRVSLQYRTTEEGYCTRFDVQNGATKANVNVFNTAKITVGGKESSLRGMLEMMKVAIEQGEGMPGDALPMEIEKFPQTIVEKCPSVDPVIVRFLEEAIICYKSHAYLANAFMLGAASERAINVLVEAYAAAIRSDANRERFQQRVAGKQILRRYDEFVRSFRSSKNPPTEGELAHDLETVVGAVFQFCRVTRNDVGHPEIVPDLDPGALLANMGHFVTYISRVYVLIQYFVTNGVEV